MGTGSGSRQRKSRLGKNQDSGQRDPFLLRVPFAKNITVSAVGAAVGFGFAKLDDAPPPADFLLLGGVLWLRLEEFPLTASIVDTWSGNISVGSVGTVDADVADLGEATILGSTAVGPAVSGVIARQRIAIPISAAGGIRNGAGGGLFLNLLINAADISDSTSPIVRATGTLNLIIAPMGKNE